jgi:serine/threonine protein phosphatase PrpC
VSKTATEAAEELCDLALKLGSSDNVTIVIVQFLHS